MFITFILLCRGWHMEVNRQLAGVSFDSTMCVLGTRYLYLLSHLASPPPKDSLQLLFAHVRVHAQACTCAHVYGGQRTTLWKFLLSFYHVGFGNGTYVIRLGSKLIAHRAIMIYFDCFSFYIFSQWGCLCNFKRKSSPKLLSRSIYIPYIKYTQFICIYTIWYRITHMAFICFHSSYPSVL